MSEPKEMYETGYFTCIVPFVPAPFRTEWHPSEKEGPFNPLSRGAFRTEAEALQWGKEHLNGMPYFLRWIVGVNP